MPTFPRRNPAPTKRRAVVDYRAYREEVREDFNGFCAYCGVHEHDWPHGPKNYCLDHFKPKGRPEFAYLKNDFYNLRWCCRICNGTDAKGDKWPSPEEEALGFGFVDLCEDDWKKHYRILADGKLEGRTPQAEYTIQAIGLNNAGYVRQRISIFKKGSSIFD